jgi:hypothetical protein
MAGWRVAGFHELQFLSSDGTGREGDRPILFLGTHLIGFNPLQSRQDNVADSL